MLQQQPQVSYTVQDVTGSSGRIRLNFKRNIDAATAMAAVSVLRGHLTPLTGCTFTRQSVVYSAVEQTPAAPANVHVSRMGVFVFSTTAANQYAVIELPGLRDSMLMTTGPGYGILIDQSKPEIGAFIAEMISGRWCNRFGYVITECESAMLQLRR